MKKIKQLFKKHWWKILLILIIGLIGWQQYQKSQAEKEELVFEQPVYRDITKILEVSGVVDAKERANLRFAAGGKVVYLGAQEGDFVKKWQTIATIDQRDLQKRLQQDLNLYMKERWDWENTQDDIEHRWLDDPEQRSVDQEQWDLENEVLDVEIRDIAISNTYLTAPFDGILVSSPTSTTGVTLLASDVFELVNPQTLVFKAAVDEADIPLVQLGQTGKIFLDAYSDDPIQSVINYIAYKSSSSSTGTVFVIEFSLSNSSLEKYRLGMNGDVEIELDSRQNVLTIPFIATKERNGQVFVEVLSADNQIQEKQIEVGLETEDWVEILSGLSEDDQILIPNN